MSDEELIELSGDVLEPVDDVGLSPLSPIASAKRNAGAFVPRPKNAGEVEQEEEAEGDDDAPALAASGMKDETELDMTPMVDCVFQLLIFFMVTASFALQRCLIVPTPKDDRPSTNVVSEEIEDDVETVTVIVDENNTYRVEAAEFEEEAPSQQDLIIKLKRARQPNSQGKVPSVLLVKAHGDALHSKVVAALDAGPAVGMEQIKLMSFEESD